jgi:hypothetical protein
VSLAQLVGEPHFICRGWNKKKIESIFGFLFDAKMLKSLNKNFKIAFSHKNLWDVDVDNLFFEPKVLQMFLSNVC